MATPAVTLEWGVKCYTMTSEDTVQDLITVLLFVTKNRKRIFIPIFSWEQSYTAVYLLFTQEICTSETCCAQIAPRPSSGILISAIILSNVLF